MDTSDVAGTDINLPMSGKPSLPQTFNQLSGTVQESASDHHLQLAQGLELVNPS